MHFVQLENGNGEPDEIRFLERFTDSDRPWQGGRLVLRSIISAIFADTRLLCAAVFCCFFSFFISSVHTADLKGTKIVFQRVRISVL